MRPAALVPSDDCAFLSDLKSQEQCSLKLTATFVHSGMNGTSDRNFQRFVQAGYMLSRVVQIVNNTADADIKLLDMQDIDAEIHNLLTLLVQGGAEAMTPHSSAITIATRQGNPSAPTIFTSRMLTETGHYSSSMKVS